MLMLCDSSLTSFGRVTVMQVRKAVITAAAPNQNRLPLQQLVDRNGHDKTALQLIMEETAAAGVEEICVVIRPGDHGAYRAAAGNQLGSLHFVEQPQPRGYADAIFQAKSFVGDDPFLHLVGDHLYLSSTDQPCARQLVQVAGEFGCCVSAVQSTRENNLPYFGIVSGRRVPRHEGLYEIERVVEKPTPTLAEQELVTPGLRAGHYLGFFGMHVLTPDVMDLIEHLLGEAGGGKATLSDAARRLPSRGRYLACELKGSRYNLGIKYGLLKAQLAIGLSGDDRDQILTEIVDLLSNRMESPTAR
jgi:UTP--glucose-1-phosphate uridylyltransferase